MRFTIRIRRALVQFFRGARCQPEPSNDAPGRECPITLEDLPPELLQYILGYITDDWKNLSLPSVSQLALLFPKGTSTPLKAASEVNRRLRALCRPLLFRLLELDPSGPLPPSSILQHVRYMHVNPPITSDNWEITDDFMLQMRRLERVCWHGPPLQQAPLSHLRLLLASPTLHTLILSNVWLQADIAEFTIADGLRTLRIDFSRQVQNRDQAYPEFVAAHLACLDGILDSLRPKLESLTLSGYSARLSSLAASAWPSLRVFSLTRGNADIDTTWGAVLSRMPCLSSLTIALDHGKTIIFADAESAQATPLSNVRHFTISFPDPDDSVFSCLTADIRALSLRDTPRYYSCRDAWLYRSDTEPILTCTGVLRIFATLSATNLRALELVYLEDPEEFRMLALLSQSCPNLTLLELHRYPAEPTLEDAWYNGTLSVPVDAIADSLSALTSLRVLKLNLCFTDYDVTRFVGTLPPYYWERLGEFLEAHASTIVLRVPWIRILSFLTWSTCGMHWDTWSVHPGDPAEGPRLVHEDAYHASYEGCKERAFF